MTRNEDISLSEKPTNLQKLMLAVKSLINKGQYSEAQSLFKRIENRFPNSSEVQISRYAVYIGIGLGMENSSFVWKGIKEGTKLLKNEAFASYRGSIHYNLGNGYSNLFSLKRKQDPCNDRGPDNEELKQAKKHFRLAIEEIPKSDHYLLPNLWTNYANCLSHLGRDIEALDKYDKALAIIPDFPMAVGNKAEALIRFADISGNFRSGIYQTAYQMLQSIIENPDLDQLGGQQARQAFQKDMVRIESLFDDHVKLMEPVIHPPFNFGLIDEFKRNYIQFCLEKKIFLNLHVHSDACNAAIGDPVFIQIITAIDDDNTFSQYAIQINQIKEDFIVARLQLFLALYRSKIFDDISQMTTFVRYSETSTFTLYTGLLKAAFRSVFGILDKVACFVNEFCQVGLKETSIQFSNPEPRCCVWKEGKYIRQQILQKNNPSLFAIYDIYLDFSTGYYSSFHGIRNALTHRRLEIVHNDRPFDDIGTIGFSDMVNKTIDLMQLTRAVILYLINFVSFETHRTKMRNPPDKIIGKIFIDSTQVFNENHKIYDHQKA
jgi:tetratricopeptide (TPR) repeat protein